jgi:hypothetical protein
LGPGEAKTISVDVKLRTGGSLTGLVVDHTDHGLVVVSKDTPYVFAWSQLAPDAALSTMRALLVFERGGAKRLTAEDHFRLGMLALENGREIVAADYFDRAEALDRSYADRTRQAWDSTRKKKSERSSINPSLVVRDLRVSAADGSTTLSTDSTIERDAKGRKTKKQPQVELSPNAVSDEMRDQLLAKYHTFGEKVREVLGRDIELIESEHFLIWTDWEHRERERLLVWCESMYDALCEQFRIDASQSVFAAKCPVFCFRTLGRFRKFAQHFDGYSGEQSVGYTRSIELTGHVHVALVRQGGSDIDRNRFATTLVHEGSHAFLHRLYAPTLIPHWVNEGLADLIAERVLGDGCVTAENADLLARQFVRYDWPLGEMLSTPEPIEVHQYPVAHSVVGFLMDQGEDRFAGFVRGLKEGQTTAVALAGSYDGITLDELEAGWRRWVADRRTHEGIRGSN